MSGSNDIDSRSQAWLDAGIIDAGQRRAILALEQAAEPSPPARVRMETLFGVLGGLLVGLGVLLTVATRWDTIGDTTKLVTIVSTMVVAYAAGLWADARSAPTWAGTAGYVVGILSFAGGIFLLADLYQVQAHAPLALLLVALAATGVGLLADRVTVGWIAAAAWLAWSIHELVSSLDNGGDEASSFALVCAIAGCFVVAVALGWTLDGVARRAVDVAPGEPRALQARVGVFAAPFELLGLVGLLGVLLQASFAWHAELPANVDRLPVQGGIVLAAVVVAIALCMRYAGLERRRHASLALGAAALGIAAIDLVQDELTASIVACTLLALGGVGLVLLGLVESRPELFILGIGWLVLLVVTRYFDFLAAVELGGPGFIGAGLLLIAVAWLIRRSNRLWQQRAEVLG